MNHNNSTQILKYCKISSKKIKSIFFFLFITSLSFSQERNEVAKPKISKSISRKLNSAKGWFLQNKEWKSKSNTIPFYQDSEGIDNFVYYQLREITYKNEEYYILIKKDNRYYYRYPNTRIGLYRTHNYLSYVFKKTEWEKTSKIKNNKINLVEINLIDKTELYEDDRLSVKKIHSSIESNMIDWGFINPDDSEITLILHIAPYKEKDIVQFQIYEKHIVKAEDRFSKDRLYIRGVNNEYKLKENNEERRIYLTDELFSHCYFEVSYKKFNKFINLE